MPHVSISKKALKTLERFLTKEEAFDSILAVADYIWDGVEPDNLSDNVKAGYDTIMEYTRPEAEKWFKKTIANRENGKKGGRPRKG